MALSAQTLRTSPYSLPQPGVSRLPSSRLTVPYSSPAFSNTHLQQQQHHYSINYAASPPSHSAGGLAFQNSMLLPGGSQSSMLPPSSTTSIQLPGSPSQESVILPSTGLRRQSVGSHDSPINPGSPILDDDSSGDQYKNCQYRTPIGSMGINAAFNSFPGPHHHQSTSLPHLATGMGYPNPSSMCPSSMYGTQDSTMCPNSVPPPPLGMPVWSYPTLPSMSMNIQTNGMAKLSMDSPRYKLTPERAVPLIKWFEEHKEHPYPTRHEKMMLCQSTQLTYTQVSTWFANARRRLKKTNSDEEENRSNHSSSDECASHNNSDSPLHLESWARSFTLAPEFLSSQIKTS